MTLTRDQEEASTVQGQRWSGTDWRMLVLIFIASFLLGPTLFGGLGIEGWWRLLAGAVVVVAYTMSWRIRGPRRSYESGRCPEERS